MHVRNLRATKLTLAASWSACMDTVPRRALPQSIGKCICVASFLRPHWCCAHSTLHCPGLRGPDPGLPRQLQRPQMTSTGTKPTLTMPNLLDLHCKTYRTCRTCRTRRNKATAPTWSPGPTDPPKTQDHTDTQHKLDHPETGPSRQRTQRTNRRIRINRTGQRNWTSQTHKKIQTNSDKLTNQTN